MEMPGRVYTGSTPYRYGFNGDEHDDEWKSNGNSYTTDYRSYDPRLCRWTSTDPIVQPWESPYTGFSNNPIYFSDPSGLSSEGPKGVIQKIKNWFRTTFQHKVPLGDKHDTPEAKENHPDEAKDNHPVNDYKYYQVRFTEEVVNTNIDLNGNGAYESGSAKFQLKPSLPALNYTFNPHDGGGNNEGNITSIKINGTQTGSPSSSYTFPGSSTFVTVDVDAGENENLSYLYKIGRFDLIDKNRTSLSLDITANYKTVIVQVKKNLILGMNWSTAKIVAPNPGSIKLQKRIRNRIYNGE